MGSSDIVVSRPDASALAAEAAPMVAQAQALVISDVPSHETALEIIKGLRSREKKIADHFEPARKALDLAKKEVLEARDSLIRPMEAARVIVSRKADIYEAEQRRIAEELRRKAEEEARKREEERQLLEAIQAEEAGDAGAAEEILAAPVCIPTIQIAPETAKVAGVSSRQTWSAEVHDFKALVAYVAAHPEWLHLLQANATALNGLARSQQGSLAIPGVRAVAETTRSVRTA